MIRLIVIAFLFLLSLQATGQDRWFITFCGKEGVPGHAFVVIGREDPVQMATIHDGTWGLYPKTSADGILSIIGEVPGEIRDDRLTQTDHILTKNVTESDYREALRIKDSWAARGRYELTERDCLSFAMEILELFRGRLTIPNRRGFNNFPARYMETLIRANRGVDIRYDDNQGARVPRLDAPGNNTSWATSIAMLLSWRDRRSYDPQNIVELSGENVDRYTTNNIQEGRSLFAVFGLTVVDFTSYSVSDFADLLNNYGPLYIASREPICLPHSQVNHEAKVVVAMVGDGTPGGTQLTIYDPYSTSPISMSYTQFLDEQIAAADSDNTGLYVVRP